MKLDAARLPRFAREVRQTLCDAGYVAYFVGGCVRDLCLGKTPGDVDVASSARPEEVKALFPHTADTGILHGTVTVCGGGEGVEVTTFRREGAYSDGRHPDGVDFDADARTDALRRDFTVNALFMDGEGTVIDFVDGCRDLAAGVIRAVGDPRKRFEEDGLRLLRAYRFCASTGFVLEENTRDALLACADRIRAVAPERICAEMEKLLESDRPETADPVCRAGLLCSFGVEGALSERTRSALASPGDGKKRLARLAAGLCADGKIPSAEGMLRALRCDRSTISLAEGIRKETRTLPRDRVEMKFALCRSGPEAVRGALAFSDDPAKALGMLEEILVSGECWSERMLCIGGRDLPAEGEACGRILRMLTEHCIRHPEDNRRERLLALAEEWL